MGQDSIVIPCDEPLRWKKVYKRNPLERYVLRDRRRRRELYTVTGAFDSDGPGKRCRMVTVPRRHSYAMRDGGWRRGRASQNMKVRGGDSWGQFS